MRPLRRFFLVAIPAALLIAAAACSSSNKASGGDGTNCTPGAYVYCRCEDRSEGTKLCHADGKSFDECKCDGSNPPPTDDPLGDGGIEQVDSGPPPPAGAEKIDPKCKDKLGVVAGDDTSMDAYVASYKGDGTFTVSKSTGPGLRGPATLLPAGGNLVATYLSRYGLLAWSKLSGGTWSPPVSIGDATSTLPPATALYNGDLKLVYLGQDGHYKMGTYSANGWDDATQPAEYNNTQAPVTDRSAPAAASVGTSLVVLVAGSDGNLARETYTNSWGPWIKAPEGSDGTPPTMVALEAGASKDILMVWPGKDLLLHAATRDALNHSWSAASLVDQAASSTEISIAPLADGTAMMVFRSSTDDKGYYSIWSQPGFSAPKELLPGKNPQLAGIPSVTRGRCGSDATLAYAQKSDGTVKILRYMGGTWHGPFDVGGVPKASWVGVGEMP